MLFYSSYHIIFIYNEYVAKTNNIDKNNRFKRNEFKKNNLLKTLENNSSFNVQKINIKKSNEEKGLSTKKAFVDQTTNRTGLNTA